MKAQQLFAYGPQAAFQAVDLPRPEPGPGQVLVRVAATSVNPIDVKIRTLGLPLAPELPAILHGDVAGVVEGVGPGVTRFAPGDRVFGCAGGVKGGGGALAEYMVADARLLARVPDRLPLADCAALPLVTLTAWEALLERVRIEPGDQVLIQAGAGGVGHVAVQLARLRGAVVHTTVSTPAKAALARELGADHTIDYRTTPLEDYRAATPGGRGFDLVFDTVGTTTLDASFQAARVGGTVVTCVARSTHDLSPLHLKGLSLHVVFMLLPLLTGRDRKRHGTIMERAATLVDAGRLRPLIHPERFPLERVTAAHALVASGQALGKVLVTL
ncbi:MAG: zinc-binding dehydrogenase [Magnetococcales bacterium]|nr:zinc-binding dehydrogenase [Magnetococcales bacterium]